MARFVLVHGAFAGAWAWGPLTEGLEAAGHSVETLDLPGSGEDHTPVADVTLEACAERLCEQLRARDEPAVVVPNSMGGVVTTQATVRCSERVAAIVYVAAFVPEDGESLLDLTRLPEGAGDQVQANVVVEGEPPVATMPVPDVVRTAVLRAEEWGDAIVRRYLTRHPDIELSRSGVSIANGRSSYHLPSVGYGEYPPDDTIRW